MGKTILKVEGLSKCFGKVIANKSINMEICEGEILSIIGENGAGKSTFCKMLTGLYHPDEGNIYLEGVKTDFHGPNDSLAKGISMVYQERNLIGMMTGAQNISFGNEPLEKGLISQKKIKEIAEELKEKLDLKVPLDVPVETLGAGAQQLIEIMRAFNRKPKLLILDEPTASLGEGEIEPFLNFIMKVKKTMNIGIIYISHKIEEVFQISDKIAVFTDGENTLTDSIQNVTQEQCISAMLRAEKIEKIKVPEKDYSKAEILLKAKGKFCYDGKEHDIDLEVNKGEIVGFYGLVGSGRTECAEAMIGVRASEDFNYEFANEMIGKRTPLAMINRGMIMTPELRANAIFKTFSLKDNICNLFLNDRLASKYIGFVDEKGCQKLAEKVLEKNNVKFDNPNQAISSLSGGNIQKIIIGRSIEVKGIKLLILDEPTNGMDIGAKHDIYRHLRELVEQENLSIIFISSEIDELLSVSDRMYVFAEGSMKRSLKRAEYDKASIIETAIGRRS